MDRQQILDLYEWHPGACFRHPAKGDVATAQIKTIRPRVGEVETIRACEDCVIELEQERWVEASRNGVDYQPGHAGEALL
ncbi:hypothetical protein ACIBAC_11925 [Streptomyces sp. NPDC051362]|uniref:hypothetical protein n=1 Tax=Streptomyces sp. NPDC051362 TaxID=3365651 RepID=UPI0037A7820B